MTDAIIMLAEQWVQLAVIVMEVLSRLVSNYIKRKQRHDVMKFFPRNTGMICILILNSPDSGL